MLERDYNNSYDKFYDTNHDGKIDWLEQYMEVDHLSGGSLHDGDRDLAHDYMWREDHPDPLMIHGFSTYRERRDSVWDDDDDWDDEDDLDEDDPPTTGMMRDDDNDGFFEYGRLSEQHDYLTGFCSDSHDYYSKTSLSDDGDSYGGDYDD